MPGDPPQGSDGADSKSTPNDKKTEKTEAAKEAVKDLATTENQDQIRTLPRTKEVKYTGGVYTNLKIKGGTSEIRKMLKKDDAKEGQSKDKNGDSQDTNGESKDKTGSPENKSGDKKAGEVGKPKGQDSNR